MKHMKLVSAVVLTLPLYALSALDLSISGDDTVIEQRLDGGFHLFIRKKPDISSVLITETTRDPALKEPNYAYRPAEWNRFNGDELRLLDGKALSSRILSLVDSTPEPYAPLGEAFHIFVPYILYYGYENVRHGEIYVRDGTYLNLRAFALPYADYSGGFKDNPFVLEAAQPAAERPPFKYRQDTIDAFEDIADDTLLSTGPDDIIEVIEEALSGASGGALDLVICLDTTGSMKNDLAAIKKGLSPLLEDARRHFAPLRVGLVVFRDYNDEYLNRFYQLDADMNAFQRLLNGLTANGGRDVPEAVYEALYEAVTRSDWGAADRMIILIGDAPPHPRPLGDIDAAAVKSAAAENSIRIKAVILPQ
jgi:hypothetical protein